MNMKRKKRYSNILPQYGTSLEKMCYFEGLLPQCELQLHSERENCVVLQRKTKTARKKLIIVIIIHSCSIHKKFYVIIRLKNIILNNK